MQTKIGKNNYDFCSSLNGAELFNNIISECKNSSGNRKYTMTPNAKLKISEGLTKKGIKPSTVRWIGEYRTELKSGSRLPYGYSSFISED